MGTSETAGFTLRTESLNGLHWLGILMAVVSAGVHLLLGIRMLPSGMGISFVLAGLGFLGAVVLVLVDFRRRTVYTIGIPYTFAQIIMWYYVNFASGPKAFPGDIGALGAIDKVAQIGLIAVLLVLLR